MTTNNISIQTTSPNRITYFDILKGIAIFLVVLGHCLQTFTPNWQDNQIALSIYMFHMPLFIFISGYFFYPSVKKIPLKEFIVKKFIHLYLPSLFWGLFNVSLMGVNKLLSNKDIEYYYFSNILFTGAWFLTALFIISTIGAFIEYSKSTQKIKIWILCYFIIYFLPPLWMVNEIKFLMPFFIMGILAKRYEITHISISAFLCMFILFIVCSYFYDFSYSLYTMKCNITEADYYLKSLIRFLAGISGITCISYLCMYVSNIPIPKCKEFFSYIGTITLPIYVLHQNFLIPNRFIQYTSNHIIIILLITIGCVFLSIIAYKIIHKSSILRLLCFGEK